MAKILNLFSILLMLAVVLWGGVALLSQSEVSAQSPQYWAYAYGGTGYDYTHSIQQTKDGGYIVAGSTESF